MSIFYEGKLQINENELNLDLTLLGGQSFRWEKSNSTNPEWKGVAYDAYWILRQNKNAVIYKVYPEPTAAVCQSTPTDSEYFHNLLERYFRIGFDLPSHVLQWKKSHQHFAEVATNMKAVRVLDQDPLENILSFICSQNNHIKRISAMIQWLCSQYGKLIGNFNGRDEFTFPHLDVLAKHQHELDSKLREAKFGYRAKFIAQSVTKISQCGGAEWFAKLRELSYAEARSELVTLPGIGFKVADCICLMSLNHLESVPIDTHIFKIAQTAYLPHLSKVKSVTPKIYEEISSNFRSIYGRYAGWTQAILFCSELQQFQTNVEGNTNESNANAKKQKRRKKC